MKKRLLCLFLCLVMMLPLALASCSNDGSDEEDISETASESAITLTMWVVSEEKVSDAAAAAVSKALNSITQSKFKIKLVLNYFTEDEYRAKLESTILAYEEAKKNQVTVETETAADSSADTEQVTDETMTNEYGMSVIKYPEAIANQVDIVYITGEDMYIDFINNGWLSELDTELSSSSKKIKEYVSSTLLSAAKQDGTTYAIPNNRTIGEYTYMLLNKELVGKYAQSGYVQEGMIDGFYNEYLYTFLRLVYQCEDNVIPIDSNYEYCLDLLAHYWSIDPENYSLLDEFSVFGSHYTDMASLSRGSVILGYDSLFEDEAFTENYLQLNKFKYGEGKGSYFGDASTSGKTAAVKFVTGDSTVLKEYEDDYYAVVVEYPTATSADIYDNMFGVCKYTRSVSRSMQIITYLNTNADFRNLLQYGVENTHYELEDDEDGNVTLKRLNNEYMMDIYSTGNVFIAYPEPDMSEGIWESGKEQNRYSIVDPLLGFDFAEYAATTGEEEETVTLSNVGYNLSYTTGYSKDVLGQNETIAKWLTACDAAGKGVYVLETSVTEGQYKTINYYVYNNNLTKNAAFTVEDIRVMETQLDSKGNETQVQTDLDFVFTYTDATGNSKNGYELSLVSLYLKKTNEFEIKARVNDSEAALNLTQKDSLLTFDFLNTDEYTIDLYENLTKPTFLKNDMVLNWISDCDAKKAKNATSFLMTYSQEKDGKMEYTYVFYRDALKYVTELNVQTTGNKGELNLAFNFTDDGESKLDTSTEADYILCYVRVIADKDVEVSYSVTYNGATEKVADANITAEKTDPDFTLLGNLDTELVKYLYQLNQDLVAVINGCQTYEKLETVVSELKILLSTDDSVPAVSSFVALKDVVEKYLVDGTLDTLHSNVQSATSYKTKVLVDDEGEEITYNGESYVYFDSPYGIYYSWMETYGFLPSKK